MLFRSEAEVIEARRNGTLRSRLDELLNGNDVAQQNLSQVWKVLTDGERAECQRPKNDRR